MTIILKEILQVDQTLDQGTPTFKGRALLAYGHCSLVHGLHTRRGLASYGFQAETTQMYTALGLDISNIAGFDIGGAQIAHDGTFYGTIFGASSVAARLQLNLFGCGELGLIAGLDAPTYAGLFVMGGKTLHTKVGYGTFGGVAGPLSVTGVGFQPDLILMGGTGRTSPGGPDNYTIGIPYDMAYGAADWSGNQFAFCAGSSYITGVSNRTSRSIDDACFLQLKPNIFKARLTSMDADGFTLDASGTVDSGLFWWAAIHDPNGQFAVGTAVEGDASFTPGFTPEAVMFASTGNTVFGTSQSGCAFCFGGADADGAAYSGFAAGPAANAVSTTWWSTDAITLIRNPTGLVTSPLASATVDSWGGTCGLDWSASTAAGVKFGWVAMRTSRGPGFEGCGGMPPQIYRILRR